MRQFVRIQPTNRALMPRLRAGFTLLELAMVLIISAMMVDFGMQALQNASYIGCYSETKAQLGVINQSLERFVRANNRFPLPAARGVRTDNPVFGREAPASTDSSIDRLAVANPILFGALPFQALGLSRAYAVDCWGSKFTYVVTESLTSSNATTGLPASTTTGGITINTGTIASPSTLSTAMAYAVISHGPNKLGAVPANVSAKGWCSLTTQIDSENCSINNAVLFASPYNDGANAGLNYFDDVLTYAGKPRGPGACAANSAVTWNTNCAGSVGELGNGDSATITNTAIQYHGTVTATCTNGTLSYSGGTCSSSNACAGASVSWGGSCSGPVGSLNDQQSVEVTNTAAGFSGRTTATCAAGILSVSGGSCNSGCPAQTVSWLTNCSVSVGSLLNGQIADVSNTAASYVGSERISCNNGVLSASNQNCQATTTTDCASQLVSWSGASGGCSMTVGALTNSATSPLTNSAAGLSGTATATCTNGLVTASGGTCNRNCLAQTVVWSTNCSMTTTGTGNGGAQSLVNTAYGYTGTADAVCSNGAYSTSNLVCNAISVVPSALYCWGNDDYRQLGVGGSYLNGYVDEKLPRRLESATNLDTHGYTSVSAGAIHSCATTSDGAAYCWGANYDGELGTGNYNDYDTAVKVSGTGVAPLIFTKVSAGSSHSCGLTATGAAYCWGDTYYGIGDGTSNGSKVPVQVLGSGSGSLVFTDISAGTLYTCAINAANEVYCWGYNGNGQLGNGTTANALLPTKVVGSGTAPLQFTQVLASNYVTCALNTSGAAYCWGNNSYGGVGDGTFTDRSSPTLVSGSGSGALIFTQIKSGLASCAINASGEAYCWGHNSGGAVGDGTFTNRPSPTKVVGSGAGSLIFTSISGSGANSCALNALHQAYCWGYGFHYAIGNMSTSDQNVPTWVMGTGTGPNAFSSLSSGDAHVCGLTIDGEIFCWGSNDSGQIGNGLGPKKIKPTLTVGPVRAYTLSTEASTVVTDNEGKAFSAGTFGYWPEYTSRPTALPYPFYAAKVASHFCVRCALEPAGALHCYTGGYYNCVGAYHNITGDGTSNDYSASAPGTVTGSGSGSMVFTDVSANDQHVCGLTREGAVYCWGKNDLGELGDGTFTTQLTPVQVVGSGSGSMIFRQLATSSDEATCGVTVDGSAYCWGRNIYGGLGINSSVNKFNTPQKVVGSGSGSMLFTEVAVARDNGCAVTRDGQLYCWGSNIANVPAYSSGYRFLYPGYIDGGSGDKIFRHVALGRDHFCASSTTGSVYCLGRNYSYQLGDGSTNDNWTSMVKVSGSGSNQFYRELSSDQEKTTCGLTDKHSVYCWGKNDYMQAGVGHANPVTKPTSMIDTTSLVYTKVARAQFHNCGVTSSGAAYCWGDNTYGQLGDGTTTSRGAPSLVSGSGVAPYLFTDITVGPNHTCATTGTGAVYCWGANNNYQIGDTTTTQRLTPTLTTNTGTSIILAQISAGTDYTCGISTADGKSYCWGLNTKGSLGGGSTTTGTKSSPTVVTGSGTAPLVFSQISAYDSHTCARTSAGAVYCWGSGAYGKNGNGGTSDIGNATLVTGTGFGSLVLIDIRAGKDHACGLNVTGEVYCWGNNDQGQLGDGTYTQQLTPKLVPGTGVAPLDFVTLSAGTYNTCATNGDFAAYCWGNNSYGNLGINDLIYNSNTPQLVYGSGAAPEKFTNIYVGYISACALGTLY